MRSVVSLPDSNVYGLSVSNDWIEKEGRNILWLPPDYCVTSIAIWHSSIVLGHASGDISFLELNLNKV
jgi:hypothetical protein